MICVQNCGNTSDNIFYKKEKNMKTKIISFLLAMIMVIGMLASCGETPDAGNNGGGNSGENGGNGGNDGDGGNGGNNGGDSGDENIETEIEYNPTWKKTPINYELSLATDSGQFPAGTKRYYAGDYDSTKILDQSIKDRNAAAAKAANVQVKFSYLEDVKGNDWSASVDKIYKNSTTYNAGESIDIYCNFTYDLTCASVKNCFANLKSNSAATNTTYGSGKNYFRFNEADYNFESENYFDSKVGEGYFYQYMLSLTLSDDKVYVLGSNYCTDLVRAFHVVPVNIELMNTLEDKMLPKGYKDLEGNDIVKTADMNNIQYFYELVWNGHWTYDTLAKFSNGIFSDTNTEVAEGALGSSDIGDTLGFAFASNGGLPPSGVLFTSTVTILDKVAISDERKAEIIADKSDDDKIDLAAYIAGNNLVTYPETNSDLVAFADALNKLISDNASSGIAVVGTGIRESFVAGTLLFGGVISLGSLEDADYQGLRTGLGFGIVPMPVYQAGDDYQTFVHNNSRTIAIARMTTVFEQCAAYLDYVSRTSSEILEMYYTQELAQAVDSDTGSDDNARMLVYIRNHVRNVFDKTMEDIMADYNDSTDAQASLRRWHEILQRANYQISNMSTVYASNYPSKQGELKNIIAAWNSLGVQ